MQCVAGHSWELRAVTHDHRASYQTVQGMFLIVFSFSHLSLIVNDPLFHVPDSQYTLDGVLM